jgi:hypothetical protein
VDCRPAFVVPVARVMRRGPDVLVKRRNT